MDKQSELIFESYQSIAELVDLVSFFRHRSNTNSNTSFDAFVFKDKNNKKRYNLHQIVMREDDGKPEIFGTTIFDNARDADVDGMIFHSIDKNVHLHGLGDLRQDSSIKNHKFFDEDKLGWEKVREMVHKAFAMTEKQRRIKEYDMKPETEDRFKDILSNLGESAQNDRFELLKVKIKYRGSAYEVYVYDVKDNKDNCTYRIYTAVEGGEEQESEIYLHEPHLKGSGTHGQMRHSGEKLLATAHGRNFESEMRLSRNRIGKDLRALGTFLTNSITLADLKRHLFVNKLKPKTQEHFGDILLGLNENIQNKGFEITIVKFESQLGGDQDVYTFDVLDKNDKSMYRVYSSFDIALGDRENEIYLLEPHLKGKGTHGQLRHSGQFLLATTYGDDFLSELKSIPIYKKNRSGGVKSLFALGKFLNKVNKNYLKQLYFTQNLKPKTKEHFGDILLGLNENLKAVPAGKFPKVELLGLWRDEDEFHQGTDELLLKVGDNYYITREFYEEVPNILVGIYYFADPVFYKQADGTYKIKHEGEGFYDFMGDRGRLKRWNERTRQDVIAFQHNPKHFTSKKYKHGITSIDPDVVAINDFLLKFTERERQVYMLKIKPKTAKHFGDIMGGLS